MGNSCASSEVYVPTSEIEAKRRLELWSVMASDVTSTIQKAEFHSVQELVWWVKRKPSWYHATSLIAIPPSIFNRAAGIMELCLTTEMSRSRLSQSFSVRQSPFYAHMAQAFSQQRWGSTYLQNAAPAISRLMIDLVFGMNNCTDSELSHLIMSRITRAITLCLEFNLSIDNVVTAFELTLKSIEECLRGDFTETNRNAFTSIMSLYIDFMREELPWMTKQDEVVSPDSPVVTTPSTRVLSR